MSRARVAVLKVHTEAGRVLGLNRVRAREARRESGYEPSDPPARIDDLPGRYSEDVLGALASLSAEHRAVVVMRYVLEYTPGEIAKALDLPRGTVNSRLRRGLDTLEARLREAQLR